MPKPLPDQHVPDVRAQAANVALETLDAWRRHARGCKQCRLSPEFCQTRKDYERSFEQDFDRWQRSPQTVAVGGAHD